LKLRISDDLALPIEAVTQTFADLAKRGAGKTYLASVLAEEMLAAGHPIVALDPTGAWWGLRSGFSITILGGEHADVPLQETAGEVIAQAVVENRFPAVLDLSLFRKGQMIRFMVAFLETLYRLNREPLHLFVDEADAFAPQGRTYGGEENRMLGAMEDLVRRGRKRGIGCTLITQRPAVLNKNVLTQCESLFALRMTHPRDIGALEEWINVHAVPAEAKEVIDSLPSLPIGEAWFWSPGWMGTLKRIKVRKRQTFDSSATPKPGESVKAPKSLAKIDLNQLGKQIQATVQKAKENDPAELRKELARLRSQVAELEKRPAAAPPVPKVERIEVPVLKNGQLAKAHRLVDRLAELANKATDAAAQVATAINAKLTAPPPKPGPAPAPRPRPIPAPAPPPIRRPAAVTEAEPGEFKIDGPMQRVLNALAELEAIGVQAPERVQVAFLAGYSNLRSKGFSNSIGSLRSAGLIDYPSADTIALTDAGRAQAQAPERPSTTDELHGRVIRLLGGSHGRILGRVIEAYPEPIAREQLAAETGYTHLRSKGFANAIGRLRSLGFIEYPQRDLVAAKPVLFLE
jgi:uncharacterized protein